jgi:UDP-N-acetyl-D-galactosamine dehydrogenase
MKINESKIAIIGLGYVGLPLAVAFSEKYPVLGFDIDNKRINELKGGFDRTLEIDNEKLLKSLNLEFKINNSLNGLRLSSDTLDLIDANIYIVTVPTPTDKHNRPVLTPMIKATETIARYLKKGDIVIYESTVYPGVTEDEMAPLLEKNSKLIYNKDFFCGYSPERINPGDKVHTVTNILKITSGSNEQTADLVDKLYKSIIIAGTHKASSIKVAEAAKVIENSQRDLNIAFVNELSKIFNLLNIDTNEVLDAAGTKWNFLKFKPGLVGGHCIGVDPYYLAQKAQDLGYYPEIILAGRRLNDSMGKYVATEVIKKMMKKGIKVINAKILIFGFTFKENCPDFRNTRVIDLYNELKLYNMIIDIYDPIVDCEEVKTVYGIDVIQILENQKLNNYSALIFAVGHDIFKNIPLRKSDKTIIYDVKGIFPKELIDSRL